MPSVATAIPRLDNSLGIDRDKDSHIYVPGSWVDSFDISFYRNLVKQVQPIMQVGQLKLQYPSQNVLGVVPFPLQQNNYFFVAPDQIGGTVLADPYSSAAQFTVGSIRGPVLNMPNSDGREFQALVTGWTWSGTATQLNGTNLAIQILTTGDSTNPATFKATINGTVIANNTPVAPSVPLGATGLTVFFLPFDDEGNNTIYTVGTIWNWFEVTDPFPDEEVSNVSLLNVSPQRKDIYFTFFGLPTPGRIYRVRNKVMTQVGYEVVSGRHVDVYYGHLMVSQFSVPRDNVNPDVPYTVGYSDLNNPDLFFATLINEADQRTLDYESEFSSPYNVGITGLKRLSNLMIAYTTASIWSASYQGLPTVMQFGEVSQLVGSPFPLGVVSTPIGHIFPGSDNQFYLFNGIFQPTAIGNKIVQRWYPDLCSPQSFEFAATRGFYNKVRKECVWYYVSAGNTYAAQGYNRALTYNLTTQAWAIRGCSNVIFPSMPLSDTVIQTSTNGEIVYGLTNNGLGRDLPSDYTLVGPGTSVYEPQPLLETQDMLYDQAQNEKEINSMMVDAGWSAGTQCVVYVSARQYVSDPITWQQGGSFTFPQKAPVVTIKKAASRVMRYRIVMVGVAIRDFQLHQFGEVVNLTTKAER